VVVVERSAAEFFQGRVLSVADTTLKVQTSEEGEPVLVARSDAYRVPPEHHAFTAKDAAICAERAGHWVPCLVANDGGGGEIVVRFSSGEERPLERAKVLSPSAVTALDISRHFEAVSARKQFDEDAHRSGVPPRRPGWIPERKEPVLAVHGGEWFSAHVVEPLGDGGVRLVWDGDEHAETVRGDLVAPVPPSNLPPERGKFALARPETASQPWERVRIEAVGPSESLAVGVDGRKRKLDRRSFVPLLDAH
jgi:hypothetical protein